MLIYISTGKNGGGANFSVIFHWLVDMPQTECVCYENKQSSARIGSLPCNLFLIYMCTRNVDCIYVGQNDLPVNNPPPPSYGITFNKKKHQNPWKVQLFLNISFFQYCIIVHSAYQVLSIHTLYIDSNVAAQGATSSKFWWRCTDSFVISWWLFLPSFYL